MVFDFDRCSRALSQPMFLLRANKVSETHWTFLVRGYSGTNYDLTFSDAAFECSCPDFRARRDKCKHVFFIFGRVLSDIDLMVDVDSGLTAKEVFSPSVEFSDRLERRIQRRLERHNHNHKIESPACAGGGDRGDNDDCVVCFEPIQSPEWVCAQCHKPAMHSRCAREWFGYCQGAPSCPLCRAQQCDHKKRRKRRYMDEQEEEEEEDGTVFDLLTG